MLDYGFNLTSIQKQCWALARKLLYHFICFEIWKQRNNLIIKLISHQDPTIFLTKAKNRAWEFYVSLPIDTHVQQSTIETQSTIAGHELVHVYVDASFVN